MEGVFKLEIELKGLLRNISPKNNLGFDDVLY